MQLSLGMPTVQALLGCLLAVLFVPQTRSYPYGAGSCRPARNALGGPHLYQTIVGGGDLSDHGLELHLDGAVLVPGVAEQLQVGKDYAIKLVSKNPSSFFRGFLIRLESSVTDTTLALRVAPTATDIQVSDFMCVAIEQVGGLTHTNRNDKQSVRGVLRMTEPAVGMYLDVTVVVRNGLDEGISEFYYSEYILDAVESIATPSPTPIPTAMAITSSPTTSPMVEESFSPSQATSTPSRMTTPIPSTAPAPSPTTEPSPRPTTASPTPRPTTEPSPRPTTASPTPRPTSKPSLSPSTAAPTRRPSPAPSKRPTTDPSMSPTNSVVTEAPVVTDLPTMMTQTPSPQPTLFSTTNVPSMLPSEFVSPSPSKAPTTSPPTHLASTVPSALPTWQPSTAATTVGPTRRRTSHPSMMDRSGDERSVSPSSHSATLSLPTDRPTQNEDMGNAAMSTPSLETSSSSATQRGVWLEFMVVLVVVGLVVP